MIYFILSVVSSQILTISRDIEIDGFRFDADIDMASQLFDDSKCERPSPETVVCRNVFSSILSIQPTASSIRVHNQKIRKMYFSGQQSDFSSLNQSVKMALGEPCEVRHIELTFGSTGPAVQSLTQTWCLPTGLLVLAERSYLSDNFSFKYESRLNY